jgi:hypothetical protein
MTLMTVCLSQEDKRLKMIEVQLKNDTTILVAPEGKLLPEGNATIFAVVGALDEPVVIIVVDDKVIKAKIKKICFESGKAYFGWFYTPYTEVDEIYINGASITLPK